MRSVPTALCIRSLPWLGAIGLAISVAGCDLFDSRSVRAEAVVRVPRDVVFHGHVLYGGESAYLVDGHWYRPACDGWQVFAEEPLELALLRRMLEPAPSSMLFGL